CAPRIRAFRRPGGGGGGGGGVEEVVGEVSPTPTGTVPPGGGSTVEIAMIPVIKFDTDTLTIAANTPVEVFADNRETGVPHNFAVYESEEAFLSSGTGAALAATGICTAPCQDSLTLELPPGEYFFQCDVHPAGSSTPMVGTLTVQ
ncbi:MAG: plastocyanin/azurin family copper-binding protein, partial [Candidatus Methylomirabilales bacterium]